MKKHQWFFRILLYLSILFLVFYLIKFDYLSLKAITVNWLWLISSLLTLWIGFILSALSWKKVVNFHNYKINLSEAIVSHGISIFAKYLPGKVWVILGRAAYVSNLKNYKVGEISFVSLKEQLLFILIGLLISFFPAILFFKYDYWVWIILLTILVLSLIIFIKGLHDYAEKLLEKIIKSDFSIPIINIKLSLKLSLYILIYWIFYSIGFYLLVISLSDNAKLIQALAFPLAACYGILAIVTPGGIGVREGIIVAFLTQTGIELQPAITISVLSRLWFMSGEMFIFLLAIILKKGVKNE